MRPLFDSHNHLQDPAFAECLPEVLRELESANIGACLTNGTRESDWPAVAALAQRFPDRIRPSFGLHPWYGHDRSARWLEVLEEYLVSHPEAGVGECGLDRWMKNHDLQDQLQVLIPQIELARSLRRPLTIHCLQAWGPLLECLQARPLPSGGFLLHAYGGSLELASSFAELGAYFSFSGSFLSDRKLARREVFQELPRERILIETDAPAMSLPRGLQSHALPHAPDLNHPGNLSMTFAHFSALLGLDPEEARELLYKNETRFLSP